MQRLRADRDLLASLGVELSQVGPDPHSGGVRVYVAHFTEAARQLLAERYGPAVIVEPESRQWRSRSAG